MDRRRSTLVAAALVVLLGGGVAVLLAPTGRPPVEPPRDGGRPTTPPDAAADATDRDAEPAPPPRGDDESFRRLARFALRGRALDQVGDPIAGAEVVAQWREDGASEARERRAPIGGDGGFALDGLVAGEAWLSVDLRGHAAIRVARVPIPAIGEVTLVVALGGTLTGRVLDAETGAPLPGSVVRLRGWGTGVTETVAGEDGRYRFDPAPSERLVGLVAERDGWVMAQSGEEPFQVPFRLAVERDVLLRRGVRVRGRVLGPDGPVAGAHVEPYAKPKVGFPRGGVRTGDDGAYAFFVAPALRFVLIVRAPGLHHSGGPSAVFSNADGDTALWLRAPTSGELVHDVALTAGAVLRGRVADGAGAPIAGAVVAVRDGPGHAPTTTDGDGCFAIAGFSPGGAHVGVSLRVRAEGWRPVRAHGLPLDEDAVVTMVPAAIARGRVVSATGEALHGGIAFVRMVESGDRSAVVDLEPDGRFELELPDASGPFEVYAEAVGHLPGRSTAVAHVSGRPAYDVDVTLEAGHALRGRVVDAETGAPIAGARIERNSTVVATTNARGDFEAIRLPSGDLRLRIERAGHLRQDVATTLPSSGPVTFELTRARRLAGVVRFADGTPAAGVHLRIDVTSTITDRNGSFAFEGLEPGAHIVAASTGETGGGSVVLATEAGPFEAGAEDVVVVVDRGAAIAGVVRDRDGGPVVLCRVVAVPSGQAYPLVHAVTGSDGRFRIDGLAPGARYEVGAEPLRDPRRPGGPLHVGASFAGVPAGTNDLVFELAPSLSIDGTIVDEGGAPVASRPLEVELIHADDPSRRDRPLRLGRLETDARGAFAIRGIEPGVYRVELPGFHRVVGGERVSAGTSALRLVAIAGATIEGVVVDRAGGPIESALVTAYRPGRHSRAAITRATTGAAGRFRLEGLDPDAPIDVGASAPGRESGSVNGVDPRAAGPLRIELERAK